MSGPGGSGQWKFCNGLPHGFGAVGNVTPATHSFTSSAHWALVLLQRSASLHRCGGQCNSSNALRQCLGAAGSGTFAIHCLTACGHWEMQLLQHTTSLLGHSGHWDSCNALPHCIGALQGGGGGKKKFPREVNFFFNRHTCHPPNPVNKNFYPRGTFSTLAPHGPHWAHRPPHLEPPPLSHPTPLEPPPLGPPVTPPPPTPPHPPCSAAPREILWRLPRLPWPGVANHMPPILGPTHGAPGSKHMDCSHVYVQEHIDLLTPSLSQREETTAPAQCAKE